jgi:hypothetical protein
VSTPRKTKHITSVTCQVCRHPERVRIESLRASGASLESLASKFQLHKDAIWRHWTRHVRDDQKLKYLAGPSTIAQLEVLRAIGGITGEIAQLSSSVSVSTTNILATANAPDARLAELQSGLLTIARTYPEARTAIIELLRSLDAPPAMPKPNGAHTPPLIEGEAVHVG